MSEQGGESASPRRFKILAFDGGPSPSIMIRVLQRLEAWSPGFLEQVDMFSGASNGGFISLYLAHALNRGDSSAEAINGAISFESKLLRLFKLELKGFLRLATLGMSMVDGPTLRKLFESEFGDSRLGDLKKPMVSLTAFDATRWRRRSLHSFGDAQMREFTLVDAAMASAAFMPLLPSFRSIQRSGQDDRGDLLLDGALTENSTMLSALSDALVFLSGQGTAGNSLLSHRDYLPDAHKYLPRIQLLSLGSMTSRTQGIPNNGLIQRMFKLKWPPFGLQKDDEFFEYGVPWALVGSMLAGLAILDRQSTDHDMFLRKLLGYERFRRAEATIPSVRYVMNAMLDTDRVLCDVSDHAEGFWDHEFRRYEGLPIPGVLTGEKSSQDKAYCFLRWVQDCWMEVPANPSRQEMAAVG